MRKPKSDWTDLFLAFRMTLDPRKLWLAFKGVVLSILLVGLLVAFFAGLSSVGGTPIAAPLPEATALGFEDEAEGLVGSAPACRDVLTALEEGRFGEAVGATRAFAVGLVVKAGRELRAVMSGHRRGIYEQLMALWSCQAVATLVALSLLTGFVLLFVWSFYGATIMRLTGVEYALGDRIELGSAAAYTRRKHQSFYGPPLGLGITVFLVALALMVGGLVVWNVLLLALALVGLLALGVGASVVRDRCRSLWAAFGFAVVGFVALVVVLAVLAALGWGIPYVGEVLVGVLSPLALLGGLAVTMLCIWLVFGLPLMAGTVATSNVGAFDAWSRSFHYLFIHPWRYGFYLVVAAAHGAVCLAFVYLVRLGTEWATLMPLSVGSILESGRVSEPLLGFFFTADRVLLDLVFLSFAVTYAFTAATIIYFLLRRCADGTPIAEVHLEPRDRERVLPPSAAQEQ